MSQVLIFAFVYLVKEQFGIFTRSGILLKLCESNIINMTFSFNYILLVRGISPIIKVQGLLSMAPKL